MIRVIKRYESRKLYDTQECRYISLDDVARWVREGHNVKVIDNASSDDVTAQVLTQIILEEGKKGTTLVPTELLHQLVRAGEKAVSEGWGQVQDKVDRFVQSSMDRLGPVRRAREEMTQLRQRLALLEQSLSRLEVGPPAASATPNPPASSSRTRRSVSRSQPAARAARAKAPGHPDDRKTEG